MVGVTSRGVKIVDDYAHHPTEIRATLDACQNIHHNRLWCLFQPHTYTRTMALLDDFSTAFDEADKIVLDAAKEQRLDASVLLFASVLGPGDYSNSHMTQMMIEFIEGRLPASVKGGYNDFDIRDVADVLPAIIGRAQAGESYIFAHKPDEINDVLAVIAEMTGRRVPKTLPLWVAKLGAPFLMLAAKLRGKRPLYTSAALKSLEARADFPIGKSVRAFGFAPRPLEETVRDHVRFLLDEGMTHLKD